MSHGAGVKVGSIGNRRSLARDYYSPLVEPAGGAVHHLLQQHGHRDYRFHSHSSLGDAPSHHKAAAADAGHDRPAAADAGNPGTLQSRPATRIPRDDAPVPRGWRQPGGLPRSSGNPDADPVRAFPRTDPDIVFAARQPGGAGRKILCLDPCFPHLHRRPSGRLVPVDGPVGAGPHQHRDTRAGLRLHVAAAEDDDDPIHGPSSVHQPDDDALVDAADDRFLLIHAAQRFVAILGGIECHRHRHPVFHNRMATNLPLVPEGRAGAGSRAVFFVPI